MLKIPLDPVYWPYKIGYPIFLLPLCYVCGKILPPLIRPAAGV